MTVAQVCPGLKLTITVWFRGNKLADRPKNDPRKN
jgi:hypothetical protein